MQETDTETDAGTATPRPARTPVDGVEVVGALSPSRANDFLACPLLYRFRTIDRLPEPPSADAVRGTLVHRVLEELFDLPVDERTPLRALTLLAPAWQVVVEADPAVAELFDEGDDEGRSVWLATCRQVLTRYFSLEDPSRLEPAERELYVETVLSSRLLLRGVVDRIDVSPQGLVRIVDYKTGRSPGVDYEARALFQMRFYALVLWRSTGVVPAMLQLVYLGNGELLRHVPDEDDLRATERKVEAVWAAIKESEATGDWQPHRSRLCDWCAHQAICPAWGGTPPPLPAAHAKMS